MFFSLVSDCVIIIILCCYACAVGITWHTADCLQGSGTITVGCQKHNFAIIFYRIHIFTVLLLRRHSQPLYSIILFFSGTNNHTSTFHFPFSRIFEYKQNRISLTFPFFFSLKRWITIK